MNHYYAEISYNNLNLLGTVTTSSPVPNDAYYEGGPGNTGISGSGKAGPFVRDVVTADDAAINFGLYDNDGPDGNPNSGDDDGYVNFVAIVHPRGRRVPGTRPSAISSHRSRLAGWPCGPTRRMTRGPAAASSRSTTTSSCPHSRAPAA